MNNQVIIGIIIVIALAVGGWYFLGNPTASDDAMMKEGNDTMMEGEGNTSDDSMTPKSDASGQVGKENGAMMDPLSGGGSYEAYAPEKLALANSGDVVLFFRASWCPTCRILDSNLRANAASIPEGVTILDVNYDTSTALKQKYGVTYQHTLVQVDAKGNQITKWSSSPDLADILFHLN